MYKKGKIGKILWHDLTVNDAVEVSNFYHQVTGWQKEGLSMGDYEDFLIKSPGDAEAIAGICHAKGVRLLLSDTRSCRCKCHAC